MSDAVSLTMGNSTLPFGYRFVADTKLFGQRKLCQSQFCPQSADQSAGFCLIHSDHLIIRKTEENTMNAP